MGLALLLAVAPACRNASGPAAARDALPLPEQIQGFTAGPLEADAVAVRRTYARGRVRIDVTMARVPMDDAAYTRWVQSSREAFPQASLDAPPADANGFYQCGGEPEPRCSLLVQLRSGAHIEIRGSGETRRADLDALAAGLPLRALATDARALEQLSHRRH